MAAGLVGSKHGGIGGGPVRRRLRVGRLLLRLRLIRRVLRRARTHWR